MIKKCNDFVTFGEISPEVLERVLKRKGAKAAKEDIDGLLSGEKKGKGPARASDKAKTAQARLRGHEAELSNGGSLGYRGEAINDLLKRMA